MLSSLASVTMLWPCLVIRFCTTDVYDHLVYAGAAESGPRGTANLLLPGPGVTSACGWPEVCKMHADVRQCSGRHLEHEHMSLHLWVACAGSQVPRVQSGVQPLQDCSLGLSSCHGMRGLRCCRGACRQSCAGHGTRKCCLGWLGVPAEFNMASEHVDRTVSAVPQLDWTNNALSAMQNPQTRRCTHDVAVSAPAI